MKICSKCKVPNKEFNKGQGYCRDCHKEYIREWKEKNREENRRRDRDFKREKRKNQAFKDIENARRRNEGYRKKMRKWYSNLTPEAKKHFLNLCKKNVHKRIALKKSLIADFTPKQWEEIQKYFNYKCAYCGAKKDLEQEHIIPVSKGGHYTFHNIVSACFTCNRSKNNKDWFDWYVTQPFFDLMKAERIRNHQLEKWKKRLIRRYKKGFF